MAKFTKSNKAIIQDGTSLWDRGVTQPMSDEGEEVINRIVHAAPAINDNDYVTKVQIDSLMSKDLLKAPSLTGSPPPETGIIYWDTTLESLRTYTGATSGWKNISLN